MLKSLLRTIPRQLERRERPESRQAGGALTLKAGVTEAGEFEGFGSVFGVEDTYGDIVAPGAFKSTLAEHKASGTMPAMLWQHDSREPIGVWQEMSEDAKGLHVKGRLLTETVRGRDAHAILKAGAIRGLSIGFMTRNSNYNEVDQIRTVTDVELWEVSLVTFPANRDAQVTGVKASDISTERDLEKALRDAGHSKTEAKAAVARIRSSILERRDVSEGIGSAMASAERLLKSLNGA